MVHFIRGTCLFFSGTHECCAFGSSQNEQEKRNMCPSCFCDPCDYLWQPCSLLLQNARYCPPKNLIVWASSNRAVLVFQYRVRPGQRPEIIPDTIVPVRRTRLPGQKSHPPTVNVHPSLEGGVNTSACYSFTSSWPSRKG